MIRHLLIALVFSSALASGTSVVSAAARNSLPQDGPSSNWYNLDMGTTRYFNGCGGIMGACAGIVIREHARETVLDHVDIAGTTYARVEWWHIAEYDDDQVADFERTDIFYFRMDESRLLQRVNDSDTLIYDFGFQPGDELADFVGAVVGEPEYEEPSLPRYVQGNTVITAFDGREYRAVWGADGYEDGMPAPVLLPIVDPEPGSTMFKPAYLDLFYYVEGLGVWFSSFNHWRMPMVGVRTGEQVIGTPTSNEDPRVNIPLKVALHPSYPNPAAGRTNISFDTASAQQVRISLINVLGQVVMLAADEHMTAGTHRMGLDLSTVPAGVYFLRVEAGGSREVRAITIAR